MYVSQITRNSLDRKMLKTIQLCKPYLVKFIISLISFIQLLIYYLIEASLITFVVTSFGKDFFFFWVVFFLKKAHITK